MSEFKDVTIVKNANIYFDGKVTSRTVIFQDGSRKTLGIMMPGEYEFDTANKEIMEILSGELKYSCREKKNGGQLAVVRVSKFLQNLYSNSKSNR